MKKISIILFGLFFVFSIFSKEKKYEMRAVWIATVANIDWPSQKNLSPEEQQKELLLYLDEFQKDNLNAVVFQIRPCADAFYFSNIESSSIWLNGKEFGCPSYDVLAFFIEEAHKRAIEVHAWINPYRVTSSLDTAVLHHDHSFYTKKHLVKKYGERYYFDPGYEETRAYLNTVVADIVERYDVDAIHFDDYFYPYRIKGQEFPDNDSFEKEPRGFEVMQKDAWRRNNVDLIVSELQQTIKSIKPWVNFGISPFGVWRNKKDDPRGSNTEAGQTNYDDLYADVLKWEEEKTIDYIVPQLYWEIGKEVADYSVLIDWWSKNTKNSNLYIGLYVSGLGNSKAKAWNVGNELVRQMDMNEKYSNAAGVFLYSASKYMKNPLGLRDSLQQHYYRYPALVPPNLNTTSENDLIPQHVIVSREENILHISWDNLSAEESDNVFCYVVYGFTNEDDIDLSDPSKIVAKTAFPSVELFIDNIEEKESYTFVVTSINRFRVESMGSVPITYIFDKKEE